MISAPTRTSRSRGAAGFHRGQRDHPRSPHVENPPPEPITARRPPAPPIVTVFRGPDGLLVHAWCGHPLEFQGRRAGLELDFYCRHCVEHVPLPECVVSRIPLGPATERRDRAAR